MSEARQDVDESSSESVVLDVGPIDSFRQKIAKAHADTRNRVALILTWAVVLSLPLVLVVRHFGNGDEKSLDELFDKWFTMVGPLAGAAIGAYSVSSRSNS